MTNAWAVLAHVIAGEGGRIGLVESDPVKVGSTGDAVSAARSGGLISFAKSLAGEYARHGVSVNVVCPRQTDTSSWDDLVEHDGSTSKIGTAALRAIPLRGIGRPEEVAMAGVLLVWDESSFITGQAVSVSRGLTMS